MLDYLSLKLLSQLSINGILFGTMYGIAAIGLSLIFGTMQIIFLAQGTMIILAAFFCFWMFSIYSIDPYLSLLIIIPASLVFGRGLYEVVFRKVAGSKIIVVLGHSKCGAIKGACDHVEMGNLTALLNKIQPAIYDEKTIKDHRTADNEEFVEKVTEINVKRTVHAIMERSPILKELIESGQIGIVGGHHNIATGEVQFYDDTLIINQYSIESKSY